MRSDPSDMSSLRQRPRRTAAATPFLSPEPVDNEEQDSSNGQADTPPTTDDDERDEDEDENGDGNEDEGRRIISALDVLRVVSILLVASCALSYYVTSSESLVWGYKRPWFTKLPELARYVRGPLHLTPSQLSLYNGTSTSLPIYLCINGSIYDVSAGRHAYGPGASYSFFAGRDATRAFVTGCFRDDLTDDMRGVEEMFIPVEDNDQDEKERALTEAERREREEREMVEALEKVTRTVEKWQTFYRNHAKYFEVGKLVRDGEGQKKMRPLCESARKARPKRSNLRKKEREKQKRREKGKA